MAASNCTEHRGCFLAMFNSLALGLLLSPPLGPFPLQTYESECPSNGRPIARVQEGTLEEYSAAVDRTRQAWDTWVEVSGSSLNQLFLLVVLYHAERQAREVHMVRKRRE